MIPRKAALGLIASALILPGCSSNAGAIRVGSADDVENATIAEIYAIALERTGLRVTRRTHIGDAAATLNALARGDIDLFPGTSDRAGTHDGIVWLPPSSASDSPCLVTSQYSAEKFWLLSLSECAHIAPRLRLAASPDFLADGGPLKRLQRLYGGFRFKSVISCAPGAQTDYVGRGDAEVANAFTTDASISEERLVILDDDKHFWLREYVTPVLRAPILRAHPAIAAVLDRVSAALTQYALQQMDMHRQLLHLEPHDVADDFVRRHAASTRFLESPPHRGKSRHPD